MEEPVITESSTNIKPATKSKGYRRRMSAAEKRLVSLTQGFAGWVALSIALSSYQDLATEVESTPTYDNSFLVALSLPYLAAAGFMIGWVIVHFAERAAQRGRTKIFLSLLFLWILLFTLPLFFTLFARWFTDTEFLSDILSLWEFLLGSGGMLRMSTFHKLYTISWKGMKIIEQ